MENQETWFKDASSGDDKTLKQALDSVL